MRQPRRSIGPKPERSNVRATQDVGNITYAQKVQKMETAILGFFPGFLLLNVGDDTVYLVS